MARNPPPPAALYQGLSTGPNFNREYETQSNIPIDASKEILRDPKYGSPFTFRVLPPQVLLEALTAAKPKETPAPATPPGNVGNSLPGPEARMAAFERALARAGQVTLDGPNTSVLTLEDALIAEGLPPDYNPGDPTNPPAEPAAPPKAKDINIVNAAQQVNGDFSSFLEKTEALRATGFVAQNISDVVALDTFVGDNGVYFDARTGRAGMANQPAISDLRQAASVIAQLNQILATPPLTLLINPQSLTVTRAKKSQYQDRNRKNYIYQVWGHEQVRLNVSGRIGTFMAGAQFFDTDAPQNFRGLGGPSRGRISETTAPSGMQFATKRDSASWQNLMSLLTLYRNNGYMHDLVTQTEAHPWIGAVAIDYDQWTYVGHFESFNYEYTEQNMLGGIDFNFDFICSFVFDNSQREFVVLPISAPTPSPSDPLWSVPNRGPQPRFGTRRGNTLRSAFSNPGSNGTVIGRGRGILRR